MSAALDDWQARLERHFADLHVQRGDRPLFALEHGLGQPELEALGSAVRAHVLSRAPSVLHSLVWIVYAAEVGYGYEGDEYWQTFEEKTPGWTLRGSREWIRERYRFFHQKYGGAAPSGAWAGHFTIICWPITHAILPTDLQRQLARVLYGLRDSFSAELFESPATFGEFIAARSFNATSRFRNLVQETQLIGQIATGLLLEGQFGSAGLLHPAALQRISADLDRERGARIWLRGARQSAQERATVRGLAFARGDLIATTRRPEEARAQIAELGIEPRLVLRPTNQSKTSWEVCLEVPDLSHLLLRFPKASEVLAESRCIVAGSPGRPLARGQCLYGSQRIVLSRWPRPDEVLLQFERRDPQLDFLLRTECMLRPSPMRLFRIASDGLAYESRSLRVRPGESYVVARTTTIPASSEIAAADLACEGVYGAMLALPQALTAPWETALRQLGLVQARTIEVWPAGLAAVRWDGEGHGEWLASERPCLGISTDHSVTAVTVSLGSAQVASLLLDGIQPGKPEFIELPRLPIGLHKIRFSSRGAEAGASETTGDLDVLMRIREGRPWSPAAGPQGPLHARIEPTTPTLEQLWEGRAEIAIEGPPERLLKCEVSLIDSVSQARSVTKPLPALKLPVDPSTWSRHFAQQFCKERNVAAAYDTARACEIKFSAEELGGFTVRGEREFTPLRWTVQPTGQGYSARLLNDSGDPTPPTVSRRAFEVPLVEEPLTTAPTYAVPPVGGMYMARRADQNQTVAIIVPPVVQGLGDFGCNPSLQDAGRSADATQRVCLAAELWSGAKLSGNLFSTTRQRDVLSAIDRHIAETLCGREWIVTERAFRQDTKTFGYLQRAVWAHRHEAEAATRIGRRHAELAETGLPERIQEIASITRFLGVADSSEAEAAVEWIAQFALRIASDPAEVATWSAGSFHAGFTQLQRFPTLARAARFLVIAIESHIESRGECRELHASWRWR